MELSGSILGFDPVSDDKHGVATSKFDQGVLKEHHISTVRTTNELITLASELPGLFAVGVDTLIYWATGSAGWRPADRWLKSRYKEITKRIASPNSLFGSMEINGMSLLIALRERFPGKLVTETHPKILYFELSNKKYDYINQKESMDDILSSLLSSQISTNNDHE